MYSFYIRLYLLVFPCCTFHVSHINLTPIAMSQSSSIIIRPPCILFLYEIAKFININIISYFNTISLKVCSFEIVELFPTQNTSKFNPHLCTSVKQFYYNAIIFFHPLSRMHFIFPQNPYAEYLQLYFRFPLHFSLIIHQ